MARLPVKVLSRITQDTPMLLSAPPLDRQSSYADPEGRR
jgi:hypothetical protein